MNPKDDKIAAAWMAAAQDLGLGVKSPFVLHWRGREFAYPAYVPDFGREKGCLFLAIGTDHEDLRVAMATEAGYFVCRLDPDKYGTYDRQLFTDMLSDLGWLGPAPQKPSWYTGDAW